MADFIIPMSSLPGISSLTGTTGVGNVQGQQNGTGDGASFADVLQSALDNVGSTGEVSQDTMMNLALGGSDDLHTGAIAAVKSNTAVNYAASLVSTAINAYNQLMSMQI